MKKEQNGHLRVDAEHVLPFSFLLRMKQRISGQSKTPYPGITHETQSEVRVVKGKKNIVSLSRLPAAVKRPPEQKQQYLLFQFCSCLSSGPVVEMKLSTLVYYPLCTDIAK